MSTEAEKNVTTSKGLKHLLDTTVILAAMSGALYVLGTGSAIAYEDHVGAPVRLVSGDPAVIMYVGAITLAYLVLSPFEHLWWLFGVGTVLIGLWLARRDITKSCGRRVSGQRGAVQVKLLSF